MIDENENVGAPEQTDENVAAVKTVSNLPLIVMLVALTAPVVAVTRANSAG